MIISGDRIFHSLQGEGGLAYPAIFVRLSGCNLKCSFCDTPYTWGNISASEIENIPNNEMVELLMGKMQNHNCDRIIWSGGEPMLQVMDIIKVCQSIRRKLGDFPYSEIETNGTIKANYDFFDKVNCSPKLSSSGNEPHNAIKPGILKEINDHDNSCFKFVYTGKEDVKEISKLVEEYELNKKKIILMPEGIDSKTIEKRLLEMAKVCLDNGWSMCTRLQIKIWGNKRGV